MTNILFFLSFSFCTCLFCSLTQFTHSPSLSIGNYLSCVYLFVTTMNDFIITLSVCIDPLTIIHSSPFLFYITSFQYCYHCRMLYNVYRYLVVILSSVHPSFIQSHTSLITNRFWFLFLFLFLFPRFRFRRIIHPYIQQVPLAIDILFYSPSIIHSLTHSINQSIKQSLIYTIYVCIITFLLQPIQQVLVCVVLYSNYIILCHIMLLFYLVIIFFL